MFPASQVNYNNEVFCPKLHNYASIASYNPPNGRHRAVANTVFAGYNLMYYIEAYYKGSEKRAIWKHIELRTPSTQMNVLAPRGN
jgi:hypothetical protein